MTILARGASGLALLSMLGATAVQAQMTEVGEGEGKEGGGVGVGLHGRGEVGGVGRSTRLSVRCMVFNLLIRVQVKWDAGRWR